MAINISCMIDMADPLDLFSCIDLLAGGIFFNGMYFGLFMIVFMGLSAFNKLEDTLMISGFFMSCVGVVAFAGEWLSIVSLMIMVIIMLTGIILNRLTTEK